MTEPSEARTPKSSQRSKARARGYGLTALPDGKTRARVELPPLADGKRRQRMSTHPTRTEAEQWSISLLAAELEGRHIDKTGDTFNTRADEWLVSLDVRPITRRGYRTALKPAREAFGNRKLQDLDAADIRALFRGLTERARATNRQTMYCLRGVFDLALDDGLIRANPTARVKVPGKAATAREELTAADAALIATEVNGDRLEVCWLLTLAGLRRSEVMGLRWSDMTDSTGTIARGRTDIDPTVTTPPKSDRGFRTLPLPANIVAGLKRTRAARSVFG
jgi:integrase